jgi:sulfate permease, SulP family
VTQDLLIARGVLAEQARTVSWPIVLASGVGIGLVETMVAVAFASLVFGGRIAYYLPDGIALYLGAAAAILAVFAWRAGARGVVGGLQATGAALMATVAATTALRGSPETGFLSVIAATVLVTVLCAAAFLVLGIRRRGNLLRYIPVPVVGGFIAGAGWLLVQGGLHLAIDEPLFYTRFGDFIEGRAVAMWAPTVAFGVLLLLAVRIVRKPLVLPVALGVGLLGFGLAALAAGASISDLRGKGWLLGPFTRDVAWKPWSVLAVADANWFAIARSSAPIVVTVVVVALVMLSNVGDSEDSLGRDLDTDRELRDAGLLNLVSGALGGTPGYHAAGFSRLAVRMGVDARRAGFVAAAVPLTILVFGAAVVPLLPRVIVGGMLVFLGLSFISAWVWDRRTSLPRIEYIVVLVIFAAIVAKGYLPGFVVGLVLAVGMFAVSYGRVDLVHEVAFGDVYRSNVDRAPAERERLRALADQIQVLRVSGHMFFGSTNRLLDRIRARAESEMPPRFLVIDLQRVTGVDASAAAALSKAERVAAAHDTAIVLTGASEAVRARLQRGGELGSVGLVSFEPDLDHGLQGCEETLLEGAADDGGAADLPSGLAPYLDSMRVAEGTVLLHQNEPPGDIYVLAEGRLAVETSGADGRRLRVRTLRPGVVVGEIALYTGVPRTADVVAETSCVVLRCSREQIARMEVEDPAVAADLHRWLAGTLAGRLRDSMRTFDAFLD